MTRGVTSLTMFAVLAGAIVLGQQTPAPLVQANPTPGCTATPAQLEANKRVALMFFQTTGDARVALADPTYKQHNPAFVKGAREAGMNDYDYFKSRFGGAGRQGGGAGGAGGRPGGAPGGGAPGGGGGGGRAAGPAAPPGNQAEVVTAECDIVTVIHKANRQDPTAPPGTFYEVFTFDSFRVKDGKLVEHWDAATIEAPAQPAGGAAPAAPGAAPAGRGN